MPAPEQQTIACTVPEGGTITFGHTPAARPVTRPANLPPLNRLAAKGPCVLAEDDCTVWVPEGWQADVHESGSWLLTRTA